MVHSMKMVNALVAVMTGAMLRPPYLLCTEVSDYSIIYPAQGGGDDDCSKHDGFTREIAVNLVLRSPVSKQKGPKPLSHFSCMIRLTVPIVHSMCVRHLFVRQAALTTVGLP